MEKLMMSQKLFFIIGLIAPLVATSAIKPINKFVSNRTFIDEKLNNKETAKEPLIRVLLQKGLDELIISGRDIVVKNGPKNLGSGKSIKFNCLSTQKASRAGKKVLFASLSSPTGIIKINNQQYRGDVSIVADHLNNKCDVINQLPLEDYVASVLPHEMNKAWPIEALKAQAVAARSYALYKVRSGSKLQQFHDLESSEKNQVSGSLVDIDIVTRKATRETKGEILIDHTGSPIPVFFHAACGGRTWVPHQVWTNSVNGYTSRPCICHERKDQGWERVIEWKELFGFLKWNKEKNNLYFDEIKNVSSGNFKTSPDDARYPTLSIFYKERGAVISKSMFRRFFGREKVPSNNFKVVKRPNGLALEGKGRGHGVGMCQIGALDFARKGWNYKQILEHFFPEHKLSKIF